ncbi:class I SAM-dependent rRNA methyltransferase [Psychrobacillus lasiicapitis]|uniref:Class I SAM-dependent rRNA methyltransferase n=1 Tax=Psychrobacillus lasiicapitis TaxID=1636719 RepID=A0A544T6K7_9BACI|nr:class I SAM-dependent rRNA methyltransferase [Psychrobacillus lasiicapitis]TQR13084.1 class I SAM-dependent rRNA methyltransferase [Psychrobacillus lasiicapitis]GGA34599.1 methyltransferase [Psychrobacillus lasiicapitis]
MHKEIDIKIKDALAQELQKGVPILLKEGFHETDSLPEGTILKLRNPAGKFIGKGYVGKQNKGMGWLLTNNENEPIDTQFFQKKIAAAIKNRTDYFDSSETTAFRVFNGEGDGIGGLTIDYFDGFYLISWYSEGIYSFKEMILAGLEACVSYKGIYEKKRFDTKGQYLEDDDFVKGERGEFPLIVKESGQNFAIYLNDGAMVGVFLDQRDVRKKIRDAYSKGKTVLNTFSYTGAFSVFAAAGGATKTTSVDLAKRSLSKTTEQFEVNGIDAEQQDIIVMDVFDYFKYAKRKELAFDVVILDPPSFARSKKYTFSSSKDYTSLLKDAIAITEKNGVIVASTNNATFGMKKFKTFVEKAFKDSNRKYTIEEEFSLPSDFKTSPLFKEGNYLKVLFVRAK